MDRYSEMLQAAIDRGDPLDASLAALRQQGASIIDSVKAVRETNLAPSLIEAKRLVEASSAWETGTETHREFVGATITPQTAFSPTDGIRLFTIRDALWLMVVLAVCVTWWFDHQSLWGHFESANLAQSNAEAQRDVLESAIEKQGYSVDWQWDGKRSFRATLKKSNENARENPN